MTGINTRDNAAAIKATIYSGQLRAQLEPELIAMNYVDMITDFPDGESWEDLGIGNAIVHDYAEDKDVVFAHGVKNLDVCAVHGAESHGAVYHQLHIARAAGFGACEGNLLADFGGGHKRLRLGDIIILNKDDLELIVYLGVIVDEL